MTVTSNSTERVNTSRPSPVTRAIRAKQSQHDPMRGNIEALLRAPVAKPHPDAELIDLGERWLAAETAYDEAVQWETKAHDSISWLEAPETLYLRDGDRDFGFHHYATKDGDGRLWYYLGKYQIRENAGLRRSHRRAVRRPVRPEDGLPEDAISVDEMFPWPEKQARADEITQAWDNWRAEIHQLKENVDLPAIEVEVRQRGKHSAAVSKQIEEAVAHTVVGLQVKARLARKVEEDGNAFEPEFWTGIVNDILALGSVEVSA